MLEEIWTAPESAFVAIYGRRRVGKTHLVREFFKPRADTYFSVVGQKDAPKAVQLHHFRQELAKSLCAARRLPALRSWEQAFGLLADAVAERAKARPNQHIVVFLDELPWLASPRSGLLQSLDYYWNSRLSQLATLRLIVCGSAASWMLEKLIHAKGGLHNRITRRLLLKPFTLAETQEYLTSRGLRLEPLQILELYMAVGGIPQYLQSFRKGRSAAQNVGAACFDESGPLHDEFERLFTALFDDGDLHQRIVRTLGRRRQGVLRDELIAATGATSGGRFRARLRELEQAGFIASLVPYRHRTKQAVYRLVDEYALFYLRWIEPAPRGVLASGGMQYWMAKSRTPGYRSWAGYSFENLCLKHAQQIKAALGISGVAAEVGTWRYLPERGRSNERGAQIDLLFDRADGIITLCEMKYAASAYRLGKAEARELRRKMSVFRERTGTRKTLSWVLVAPHGIEHTPWSDELIDDEVTHEALFA